MKKGLFIYKYQPTFGLSYGGGALKRKKLFGDEEGKVILAQLKKEFSKRENSLSIEKDIANPDDTRIVWSDYDFVICGPSNQDRFSIREETPIFFYINETDYKSGNVSTLIEQLNQKLSQD